MATKIPKIRFSRFDAAWEQRKLGELGETRSGIGFPEREQGGKEGLPFYKVSDMNLPGNESIMVKANNYVTADQIASNKWFPITKVPAILFAKVGAAVLLNRKRLCGTPFLLDNNTMSYSLDPSIWVTNFAHALFETLDLTQLVQVGALPSYGKKDVEAIHISIPTLPEQEKIGNLFYLLENAIALHQKKLKHFKNLKESLLQNMFPREGEIFPRLRFPEFTDAWEQRKLGELGETRSGIGFPEREQGGKEGLPFYKVSDMNLPGNESIMVKANNYVTADQIASNKWFPITKVPAILFAKVGAAVLLNRKRLCGTPFLLDNNTMSYSLDPSIWVTNFAHALFETLDLTQLVQVGALPSYGKKDVEAIHISIPTLPEQEKIGNLFYLLENAIALHQRKLAQLKKLKTCLFNNLFVN